MHSIRVGKKNKGKRKRNKKVIFRNSVEEYYEHIGVSNNNSNESFFPESSDTLNYDLIRVKQTIPNVPKKPDTGHLLIDSVRNKFSSFQQTVLSKTDITPLSETKIDDSFPDSRFFAEGVQNVP